MAIKIDFTKVVGEVKPLHGVGQPPFAGIDFSKFSYLTEAGIPFSRLHDVGGMYGGGRFVDIPNLFRNFDADPYDPSSYDFTFTDMLITAIVKSGVEPFFRLGVTIENDAYIKSYRIDPPKCYEKWAVICEKIIRHYTEGWANGFNYKIRYWEIWNEPDNDNDRSKNPMWTGSAEDYYRLYDVTSKHLKKCFPHLKIGGYASCGFYALISKPSPREQYFMDFFDGFLDYIKKNNSPLDFFSWHSYANIPDTMVFADYARKKLDENGFTETETTLNEWNPEVGLRGSARHAALVSGMMLSMMSHPIDSAMFYDARFGVSIYGSLFNPLTGKPFRAYYVFPAFNELYKLKNQVKTSCDTNGIYVGAATDGKHGYVMLSNTNEESVPLDISMNATVVGCCVIDEDNMLNECELPETLSGNTVLCIRVENINE